MSGLSQHEIYSSDKTEPFRVDFEALKNRAESGTATDVNGLYKRIWEVSMPGHISGKFPNRNIFYSSYLQTYIQRDIGDMLSRVDSLRFEDFIRAAACRAGQMLNVHDIALDVGITDDTAKRWLSLLEKSGVIFYLRPFSNKLLKRTVKTPKMYFSDTSLVAYLTKYSTPEILMNGAINGALLENYDFFCPFSGSFLVYFNNAFCASANRVHFSLNSALVDKNNVSILRNICYYFVEFGAFFIVSFFVVNFFFYTLFFRV